MGRSLLFTIPSCSRTRRPERCSQRKKHRNDARRMSGNNTKWNLKRKSESGKEARIEKGTTGEKEIMRMMTGRNGGRRIEGTIEETTGIGIVTGKGGGMMTARTKRNAVAVRRKRDGDVNAMTTIMTASVQGAMRRTVTGDGTGVANTGGDDSFFVRLHRTELLVLEG